MCCTHIIASIAGVFDILGHGMLDSGELGSLFLAIEAALEAQDYEEIPFLSERLDVAIKSVVPSGLYDESEILLLVRRLESLLQECNKRKKQILLDSSALSKGSAGIKAYKKV